MTKRKIYAFSLIGVMVLQLVTPGVAYALTGGPSQPEFSSFTPVGVTDMVSLPNGGFQYNIPLMDVGGYPLNVAYHSDITADMEASCVGLGWTINPGVINRNVRVLPDDFKGEDDKITKEFNMKPNVTVGAGIDAAGLELFGKDMKFLKGKLSMNMGIFYNTYSGLGYEFGLTPSFKAGVKGFDRFTAKMGMDLNSKNGANFSPSLSYDQQIHDKSHNDYDLGAKIGLSVNSREGLKAIKIKTDVAADYTGKKFAINNGIKSSAEFSYSTKTFVPNISMPQNNFSLNLSYKPFGLELFGAFPSTSFSGYVSTQTLRNKTVVKKPYGLLYAQEGYEDVHALMDFNREKDAAFHDYSISLPIVNPGYDILSVAGQGIGGSFQLKRSDVPVFFDTKSTAVSNGGSLGLEAGTGGIFHAGIDVTFNNTNSFSEKWQSGNKVLKKYNFQKSGTPDFESAYYKAAGEMAIETDDNFYSALGKDKAVRADLHTPNSSKKFNVETKTNLVDQDGTKVRPVSGDAERTNRERRNQVISYLTAEEAAQVGLDRMIKSYPSNPFQRVKPSEGRQKHHISQIESLRSDGLRYIYGIPAYNLSKKEVTFNVAGRGVGCDNGLVEYQSGDDSNSNQLGKDHYFNSVTTPAYAHSYLLTAVLSQDYEDRLADGPTPDDLGSYTKINYSKMTTAANPAQWRVPFQQDSATYNPGLMSKSGDDKASYIYGTKEIWLVHSVESKTMIAEFTYADRDDAYGVAGKDGGIAATNFNKKLEKLTLYSKPDRTNNGNNAVPIKTVHFVYSYDLCPNTPNSKAPGGGKLTLKELYFTYGYSKKGKLSSYQFGYKNNGTNYDSQSYDRWGFFKPNTHNTRCKSPVPGDKIPNDEFPYSEQNRLDANKSAGTWSLQKIKLPSGGTIQVDYQAKHYAYVQDKPAMQMLPITGIRKVGGDKLYDFNPLTNTSTFLDVYFELKNPISGTTAQQRAALKRDYLKGIDLNEDYVYLKCYVKMNSGLINTSNAKWEYVTLWSKIQDYGVKNGHGFIKLLPLLADDNDDGQAPNLNPISKFSFQFIREYMPHLAYDQSPAMAEDLARNPLNMLKPVVSMISQLASFVSGFNRMMLARGYAQKIDIQGRSYVRLATPDGFKMGGGSMVSKIQIFDNWGTMTGDASKDFFYGQEYDYTTTDNAGRKISSGVSSYEPGIGGDENPFRYPEVISEDRKWAIDNVHYVENPFGEVFMPAPRVIFSEIKVRNLSHTDVNRTATGHSVMKYYTARDFPTKVDKTDLQKKPKKTKPILSLLKVKMKEHTNASQGFVVETNNMHGQAEAKEVYDENGTLISKVEYFYKQKPNGDLENEVSVINPDGSVSKGLLGVDYHLAGDARESKSKTVSGGVKLNADGYVIVFPIVIPVPWPNYESNERRYRSMSMTKVVNKYGVLDSVVAYDLGSRIATENLAYDAETGEVLLTRTYNEFEDPVFNLKLSAHLAYEGMQGAYKNIGLEARITRQSNGVFSVANANYFVPGDEVALFSGQNVPSQKGWILHVDQPGNRIFLIDQNGTAITQNNNKLKVIRSGHRNMPGASIASLTSKQNPIQGNLLVLNNSTEVLNAGAVEYSDNWQTYCSDDPEKCFYGGELNPYARNVLGNWKPKKSWLYLSERNKTPLASTSSSTNIRENGFYETFSSFWNANGNDLWKKDDNNWTWTTEVTQFNPNGTELENIDKLDRYSSEIVGYYNQLVTGVAANSRYRQIAFEGFEDYHYNQNLNTNDCELARHFGHDIDPGKVKDANYHTGKYALEVLRNSTVSSTYMIEDNCPPRTTNRPMRTYQLDDCSCIQSFSPDPGKYVVTAWVKEGDGLGAVEYKNHKLRVNNLGSSSTFTNEFQAKGSIIEGWQRIEGQFEVRNQDQSIEIVFESNGSKTVFFDDFRIFPFDGAMKNFVYDDISLKLLSEIDANGYANFYEYDASGELVRIKKETERGIITIQESRSAMPK